MSPQPEFIRHDRHELLEDLFERGAIVRAEAQRLRAMCRETRELSRILVEECSPVSGKIVCRRRAEAVAREWL